jgi:hypothetical protein
MTSIKQAKSYWESDFGWRAQVAGPEPNCAPGRS